MRNVYDGNYLLLLFVPLALFAVFGYLATQVSLGIELQGGALVSLQLPHDASVEGLGDSLEKEFNLGDAQVDKVQSPLGTGVLIKFSEDPVLATASTQMGQVQSAFSSGGEVSVEKITTTIESLAPYLEPGDKQDFLGQLQQSQGRQALDVGYAALASAKKNFDTRLTAFLAGKLGVKSFDSISFRTIGPSLGKTLFEQAKLAALTALVFLLSLVFYFFRTWLPTLAIVLAVLFDVLTALAGMAVFKIPLTLASLSAMLMIVGYSVDTDVLLTTRILKRHESTHRQRAFDAMITGITITSTAFAASAVLFTVAHFTQMTLVTEIASVILFGLFGGLIAPWFMNAPILLWLVESNKVK